MRKIVACVLLAALSALLLSSCAPAETVEEIPDLLEPVGVRTDSALVVRDDIYTVSVYEGSIVAASEELSFEIDGVIGDVLCYPGKWVEAGEALFVLDQTKLGKNIDDVQRRLDYAESDGVYEDALYQVDIDMMELELRELRLSGADEPAVALKENDIEQARLDMRQAKEMREITIQSLRTELDALKQDYGRNVLYAPFSGNVFYLDALREGTSVRAGKTVAYIANPEDLIMEIGSYLTEQRASGTNAYALIGGKRYDVLYKPMSREDMTASILAGNSLTTRFYVTGPQEDLPDVKAGMYAVLCVEGRRNENVLCVPSGAIYAAAGEKYVYVITDTGRVRRTVTTGVTNGLVTEITEGLEEGESVYVKE